ncbi:uncharacterized protein LOC6039602 isoform X1 [Culex quinquefasciatus]|uniref:uncharacterized protein LOC6039602 isoform X1 n=1 Tax=Culex quinquefasciatus TaxID=7176 RepID=UPI0018E32D66|nr:uncharacterized protein LOC6039602 isoform X1 [Culex quinquefasciatus]
MMRSIWAFVLFVKLIEGLPATSSRCELGFEEVLTGRHCDYFAVGPQALLDSYCSWDNQLSHGITQKFCCLGVCAFCFSDVNRSYESQFDESEGTTSFRTTDYYWRTTTAAPSFGSFREMVSAKLAEMMEQIEETTTSDDMLANGMSSSKMAVGGTTTSD